MFLFAHLSPLLLFVLSRQQTPRTSRSSKLFASSASASPLETIGEKIDQSKYDALLGWVKSQQGSDIHPSIELKPSTLGDGYGAFVSQAVNEGELLFAIPRSACVTLEDGTEDTTCGPTYKKLMEKAGPGGNTVVVAGFLATERLRTLEHKKQKQQKATEGVDGADHAIITDSRFGPYLDTLPWKRGTNNQEHILFWQEETVDALLAGTMAYEEAISLRAEVELAAKVLEGIVGPTIRRFRGQEASEKSGFQWPWQVTLESTTKPGPVKGLPEAVTGAFVTLLTRAFQDGGDGDEEKLVPILDLLQHSDEPNISHVMRKEDGRVEVRARRALEPGEELLNQYRSELEENMPYHRFFTRYGFVPGIQEPVENLLRDKSSIFFAQKAEV